MQRANSLGKTGQEEKGTTEDEMVGWNYQLSGHEFVQTQGDSKGQGKLGVQSMGLQRVEHDLVTEQQKRWLKLVRKTSQKSKQAKS